MLNVRSRAIVRLSLLLFAGGLLAGCVSAPPRQSFNRAASPVSSIAVLPMRPSEPQVMIMNNPGYQFGLIGALVAEANLAGKREKLRAQLNQAGFDQNRVLQASLDRALARRGYTIVWPTELVDPGKTARDSFGGRKTYTASDQAQAQLDVNYGFIGYAAAGATKNAPYRPTVTMSVRLISADGSRTLFRDTFAYNNVFPVGPARDSVTIEADPRFSYPDFDNLDAADAESAEGLRIAIEAIANKIAERL